MQTLDDRVLILMPTARDGERTRVALAAAGVACTVCADTAELCREIARGAGTAILTEEVVTAAGGKALLVALAEQPQWSDFPLILLARGGAADRGLEIREAMNATLVERPVKVRSLLSVVRAALRDRRHQYAVRDHLDERKGAEDRLRESEERFRLMADAIPVLIWVSDRSKGCTWFNKSWLDFAGRPMRELLGNGWAQDVHPDDLGRCMGTRAEIAERSRLLAGDDWSSFPPAQRKAFAFARKLTETPRAVGPADVTALVADFGPEQAAIIVFQAARNNYMTRISNGFQLSLEKENVFYEYYGLTPPKPGN